ncbi:MAG: hypothetical protein E7356_03445 [Clostridiales bacterium]|nr:hypothetical protein [Clostridiales bacterium]
MKNMLEYQKLDMELMRLKASSLKSADRANLAKLKNIIVDAHNTGNKLEENAQKLLDNYNKLKKQYDANYEKVQKLISTDLESIEADNVDSYLYQINSLSSELFMLDRNINNIVVEIKNSLKNFDVTKKNMIKAKEKYNECKEKCEKEVQTITPKLKEIEAKMKALESQIPADLFAKYKAIKADKIFPVFVCLDNGHCSGCRVELPTSRTNKLKTEGTIVCECHRIIYNK